METYIITLYRECFPFGNIRFCSQLMVPYDIELDSLNSVLFFVEFGVFICWWCFITHWRCDRIVNSVLSLCVGMWIWYSCRLIFSIIDLSDFCRLTNTLHATTVDIDNSEFILIPNWQKKKQQHIHTIASMPLNRGMHKHINGSMHFLWTLRWLCVGSPELMTFFFSISIEPAFEGNTNFFYYYFNKMHLDGADA